MRRVLLAAALALVAAGCGDAGSTSACPDDSCVDIGVITGCSGAITCPAGTTPLCVGNHYVCEGPGLDMARSD